MIKKVKVFLFIVYMIFAGFIFYYRVPFKIWVEQVGWFGISNRVWFVLALIISLAPAIIILELLESRSKSTDKT